MARPLHVPPAAESLGLAVCVVGQLARLELRSKLVNLLELHGPERAGLFLSLERGGAEYVNPKTRPDSSSNCDSEFDNATLLEAVGPYLRATTNSRSTRRTRPTRRRGQSTGRTSCAIRGGGTTCRATTRSTRTTAAATA